VKRSLIFAALSAFLPMYMTESVGAAPVDPVPSPDTAAAPVVAVTPEAGTAEGGEPSTNADSASLLGESPNAASVAAEQSASVISSSAPNASQDADTVADASFPAEPDHRGILATLLADLEGIVHMGKSEIIAVIDRAKSLL